MAQQGPQPPPREILPDDTVFAYEIVKGTGFPIPGNAPEASERMAQGFKTYKLGYEQCCPPWECFVEESTVKHLDFDGTPMKLLEGKYRMGPIVSNCLVEKFLDKTQYASYCLMKNFKHANVVTVDNFYDEHGFPRFVISWVDGSLTAWLKQGNPEKMFVSNAKGSAPTGALRQGILDLCSGLESLFKKGLHPLKIDLHDIYVRRVGKKGILQLYVNRVEEMSGQPSLDRQAKLWDDLKKALNQFYNQAPNTKRIDPVAQEFIRYIGVTDVARLQNFPDLWDYRLKARYLLSVMTGTSSVVASDLRGVGASDLQGVGIRWPNLLNGRLPSPLKELLQHELKTPGAMYDQRSAYHYLRLCRNAIKHWTVMPASVKAECDTIEKFIEKMDKWDPKLWCKIFAATAYRK